MAFPYDPQTIFIQGPSEAWAGHRYAANARTDETLAGIVPIVTPVPQITRAQVVYGAGDGEVFGLYIDGALYIGASDTDAEGSAQDWITTNGATLVNNGVLSILPTTNGTGRLELTFADFVAHTVTAYSPDATDVTPITVFQAAAQSDLITFGLGVAINSNYPDLVSPTSAGVRLPNSGTDRLAGIMTYTAVNNFPPGLTTQFGAVPGYLVPGLAYQMIRKGRVIVPIVGTMPAKGSPVYWINNPADPTELGAFRADANGGEADIVNGSIVESVIPGRSLAKVYFSQALV